MSNIYGNEEFGFEALSTTSFTDQGYKVVVQVVRLNQEAIVSYYDAAREGAKVDFENRVLALLGCEFIDGRRPRGATVTQCVSEIFTVVTMERVEEGTEP
ncbi:MAG: hypothetical protein LIO51_01505 [Clostridiales bacterium]|nr:hypothetical protein [Clostridiales bacterium]